MHALYLITGSALPSERVLGVDSFFYQVFAYEWRIVLLGIGNIQLTITLDFSSVCQKLKNTTVFWFKPTECPSKHIGL